MIINPSITSTQPSTGPFIATDAGRAQLGRSCRCVEQDGNRSGPSPPWEAMSGCRSACLDPFHFMPEDVMMQKYSPMPEVFSSLLPVFEEQWSDYFRVFDSDEDGFIDVGEILGHVHGWTEGQAAADFQDVDANDDGVLDFNEFAVGQMLGLQGG